MRDPILNRNMMFEFDVKKILNENSSMRKSEIMEPRHNISDSTEIIN